MIFDVYNTMTTSRIARRGATGTATTPATTGATTPAQKIRIYRYNKIDRGEVFSSKKPDHPSGKTLVKSSIEKEKSSAKKEKRKMPPNFAYLRSGR